VQRLIATMAAANRTWGEERVANELLLKLGIRLSPRTVRRYMPSRPRHPKSGTQAWSTFVRNHTRSVLASDFFVVVTATFRLLYVFVVLEVGSRRILHWNVTAHGRSFRDRGSRIDTLVAPDAHPKLLRGPIRCRFRRR
jgi:hypothetical protein